MRRSKRFRKKQTKRKTKKLIVGGVKRRRNVTVIVQPNSKPANSEPVSMPDLSKITSGALTTSWRAAEDKVQRKLAAAMTASAHAEKKRAEYLDAAPAAARARAYLAEVTAAVAKSEAWAKHQDSAYSAETLHELREGEKEVKDAASRALAVANALAARALNTFQIAKNEANERAVEAREARANYEAAKIHAQRVESYLPRRTAIELDSNVFTALRENTARMLAATQSLAAPPATTVPPPPVRWHRQ